MTLKEIELELEKLDKIRLDAKKRAVELLKLRAELFDNDAVDAKLAGLKPHQREKLLQKIAANAAHVGVDGAK